MSLGSGKTAVAISSSADSTCALLNNASVKCWGKNHRGQLGLGSTQNRGDNPNEMGDALPIVNLGTGKTAVEVVVESGHACAILNDSSLKCWGANGVGSLGLGDKESRGDQPNEMGDNLPPVSLGAGVTVFTLGNGPCAVLTDLSVKCWGANTYGNLGLGDKYDRGDGPNEMGDNLPAVSLGTGSVATSIVAGGGHSCALLQGGSLKCWGSITWASSGSEISRSAAMIRTRWGTICRW